MEHGVKEITLHCLYIHFWSSSIVSVHLEPSRKWCKLEKMKRKYRVTVMLLYKQHAPKGSNHSSVHFLLTFSVCITLVPSSINNYTIQNSIEIKTSTKEAGECGHLHASVRAGETWMVLPSQHNLFPEGSSSCEGSLIAHSLSGWGGCKAQLSFNGGRGDNKKNLTGSATIMKRPCWFYTDGRSWCDGVNGIMVLYRNLGSWCDGFNGIMVLYRNMPQCQPCQPCGIMKLHTGRSQVLKTKKHRRSYNRPLSQREAYLLMKSRLQYIVCPNVNVGLYLCNCWEAFNKLTCPASHKCFDHNNNLCFDKSKCALMRKTHWEKNKVCASEGKRV